MKFWDVNAKKSLTRLPELAPVVLLHRSEPGQETLGERGCGWARPALGVECGRKFIPWKEFAVSSGVHGLALSPDGQLIVCGCEDRTVRIWDIGHRCAAQRFARTLEYRQKCCGKSRWQDFGEREPRRHNQTLGHRNGSGTANVSGHPGAAIAVTFGSDGKILISGGWDSRIKLWDVSTGRSWQA